MLKMLRLVNRIMICSEQKLQYGVCGFGSTLQPQEEPRNLAAYLKDGRIFLWSILCSYSPDFMF